MKMTLASLLLPLTVALVLAGGAPVAGPVTRRDELAKDLVFDLGGKVILKAVLIPPGKFAMGSPESEKDRDKSETRHEVTISRPFYMGVTHVTVDQFAAFVKDSGYRTDAEKDGQSYSHEVNAGVVTFSQPLVRGCSWRSLSFEQKGDHPAVEVSWNDSRAFCEWLTKKSGRTVVLPTEAQWEYACRGGTKTAFPWGDNADDGKGWANCADQSLRDKCRIGVRSGLNFFSWDDGFVFTSPVASFKPNAFGLYDMIGNAWQWCKDDYGEYGKDAVIDPAEAGADRHVLRGGSWSDFPDECRSAARGSNVSNYRLDDYGFRVVVEAYGR